MNESETAQPPPSTLEYAGPTHPQNSLKTRWRVVAAMLGLEAAVVIGLDVWLLWNEALGDKAKVLLFGFAFLTIQLGIMFPITRPRPVGGPSRSPWYWLSAIALGLLFGMAIVVAIGLTADFYWATHDDFSDDQRQFAGVAGLVIAGISWIAAIPLIMAFMKRRPPESLLARLSAKLFLGSVVEAIAAIPVFELARRRDGCTCNNFSFFAILLSVATATITLGPMIFLLILSRRTRAASRGFCAACGMDLRPLVQRDPCPHCGAGWKSLV